MYGQCLELNVFPNPATDFIIIENPSDKKITKIEIFSIDGILLLSSDINSTSNNFEIDCSFLPSGIYFMKIAGESFSNTHKIIVTAIKY